MRTLSFYKMQLREHLISMLTGFAIFFAVLLALSLLFAGPQPDNVNLTFNGFSVVVAMVLGAMFWGNFRNVFQSALQNQLTRKQFALSTILLGVTLSALFLLANLAFIQLVKTFAPSIGVEDPLYDIFLLFFRFLPEGLRWVGLIVLGLATNLISIVIGLFFGALAYRFRPAVSFTLFFGLIFAGPFAISFGMMTLLGSFGPDAIRNFIVKFAEIVGIYPLNGVRWSLVMYLTVVLGFAIFWLMTRRMELKRS